MATIIHKQALGQRLSDALESPAAAYKELRDAKELYNPAIFAIIAILLFFIIGLVVVFSNLANKPVATHIEEDSDEEVKANLRQSFVELEQYKAGKLKLRSAKDVLNEL